MTSGNRCSAPGELSATAGRPEEPEMMRGSACRAMAAYLEDEARNWIEQITGESLDGGFAKPLNDGIILCKCVRTRGSGRSHTVKRAALARTKVCRAQILDGCRTREQRRGV